MWKKCDYNIIEPVYLKKDSWAMKIWKDSWKCLSLEAKQASTCLEAWN